MSERRPGRVGPTGRVWPRPRAWPGNPFTFAPVRVETVPWGWGRGGGARVGLQDTPVWAEHPSPGARLPTTGAIAGG